MKRSGWSGRVKVSADGVGVVSHAPTVTLRELAQLLRLVRGLLDPEISAVSVLFKRA